MKLWTENHRPDKAVEEFTAGEDRLLDQKLVKYDCLASIAHAKALTKAGILSNAEAGGIIRELNRIIALDKKSEFTIAEEDEDCHTAIENRLTEKLGDVGKKIHAGRSRNDQVLTALRLYEKDALRDCAKRLKAFADSVQSFAKRYGKVQFPGYTHTRKAMPSSIGLWTSAFIDAVADNMKALDFVVKLIDRSPLGTGAGYGVPLKLDRAYTAKLLGFGTVQRNPIHAQLSRGKYEAAIIHVLSEITGDLNRAASDIILFSLPELGYFELPRELETGSSIMPHKKNPDVLELVRARHHTVVSREFEVKALTSNLVSGYHRDLQSTKRPLMEALETTAQCLSMMALVFKGLKADKKRCEQAMTKELYAAEEAIKLAKKGVPFRDAYRKISRLYR